MRGSTAGPPDAKQIDTWLAIHADNTATVYIGFAELGQGTSTALLQIAAEELDLEHDQIKTVRLDTNVTPNQGGTYSSASIARGGPQVRTAAAEARLALLELASQQLGVPAEQLTVSRRASCRRRAWRERVTYGELVGDKLFNLPFTGSAPVKTPAEYKIVGTPRAAQRPARQGQRAATSTCSTCACPACCTAASCVRAASARTAPARRC